MTEYIIEVIRNGRLVKQYKASSRYEAKRRAKQLSDQTPDDTYEVEYRELAQS